MDTIRSYDLETGAVVWDAPAFSFPYRRRLRGRGLDSSEAACYNRGGRIGIIPRDA